VVTNDNKYLFTADLGGTLKQWANKKDKLCASVEKAHDGTIWSLVATPCSGFVLTGGEDLRLKLWAVFGGTLEKDFGPVHYGSILSIAVTPCGTFAFTGSEDGVLKQWDLEERVHLIDYDVAEMIGCMAISSTGKYLFSASKEMKFKQWAIVEDDY
jgi:WD40 repeat protein